MLNWKWLGPSQKPIKSGVFGGESAIVPHNPARRCSFIWMKRSKKRGFVKARPPCATATELRSSLLFFRMHFLSLSLSHTLPLPPFVSSCPFFFFCAFPIGPKVRRGQPIYGTFAKRSRSAAISVWFAVRGGVWRGGGGGGGGLCDRSLEIAQYCPRLYQTSKKDTQTHSPSRWLWVVLPRLPLSIFQIEREKKTKKNKKTRGEKAVWNES